jgi:hypothetical protein
VVGPVRMRLYVQASVPYIDCMPASPTSRRAAGRPTSPTGSCVLPIPHLIRSVPSSLISGPSRTPFGVGTGSSSKCPVAPLPAMNVTTAPQNRWPPAHPYERATVQCSTMPSTLRSVATRARLTPGALPRCLREVDGSQYPGGRWCSRTASASRLIAVSLGLLRPDSLAVIDWTTFATHSVGAASLR